MLYSLNDWWSENDTYDLQVLFYLMDEWVFMDILREALTNEVFGTLWAQFSMQHFIFNSYLHFSFVISRSHSSAEVTNRRNQ